MGTPQTQPRDFIGTHVKYEIDMLRSAYDHLALGKHDWTIGNALIESYWVHARNLLEFFEARKQARSIKPFCVGSYQPSPKSGSLYRKICQQISHLKDGRTDDESGKLDALDPEFLQQLEEEIERFRAHMKDEYKDLIPARRKPTSESLSASLAGEARTTTSMSTTYMVGSPLGGEPTR